MNINSVPAGENIPDDIYVIIEIPAFSNPIKYEINKKTNVLFVDRFLSVSMFYPCNYGFINQTLSLDRDPLDVLVQTPYPLQSQSVIRCRPIGMLNMIDESGNDSKIIAVPHYSISHEYDHINDIDDLSSLLKLQILHFFETYKSLDKNKWVKINGWVNAKLAKEEIKASFKRKNLII